MATKPKGKASKSSFEDDDILDSLFDDKKPSLRGRATRGGQLNRSSATDNIYSMLAEEVNKDGGDSEDSDVSAVDPSDILKNMKDMDDMDADLFGSKKKPSSAPAQTKPFVNERPKTDSATLENKVKPEAADKPSTELKKPNSAPSASTGRNYKKFTFSDSGDDEGLGQTLDMKDLDDPLADLLDSKTRVQQSKPEQSVQSPSVSPMLKSKTSKTKAPIDLTFDDSKDDLMDALGFDSDKNNPKKKETPFWSNKESGEPPQRARTRLDEILESWTAPRLLERPPTGERKDELLSQEKQQQERTTSAKEDDFTFGSYQPTVGSTPEGRQSRRQSVRFSTEDVSSSTPERKPKPTTPIRHRNSADWLGLKTNDDSTLLDDETKITVESPKHPSSPLLERKPSFTGSHAAPAAKVPVETQAPNVNVTKPSQTKPEVSKIQKKEEEEEDDWLAGALSRKKTLSASNSETKTSKKEESLGTGQKVESFVSKVTSQTSTGREDSLTSVRETSGTFPGPPSPSAQSTPIREERSEPDYPLPLPGPLSVSAPSVSQPQSQSQSSKGSRGHSEAPDEPLQQLPLSNPIYTTLTAVPQQNEMKNTSTTVQREMMFSANSLQQLLLQQQQQQMMQSLGGVVNTGGDSQALQVCIIQLEGQVKTLQLERDQSQMLLESVQQRHKQDIELLENTHKARVKLLEESAAQRETRARQECEDLMERLATVTRSAEQERSELQAQYRRKLAQAQEDRDREVERLRDLQRKSILEMRKDHEDQVQRLKKFKDEEIDAVTSATSQTRSLTVAIEQMEQFSSRLGELSSRVEQLAVEWTHFHGQERLRHERTEREASSHLEKREGAIISLAQEQADLKLRTAELKQKEAVVAQERETLERLREELEGEKERVSSTALRLKIRAQEVEAFSKLAAEKYEEGERALQEAKRVEAEHEERLRNVHVQTEQLRQRERRILQEQMKINQMHKETEKLRTDPNVVSLPQIVPPILPDSGSVLPDSDLTQTLNVPIPSSFANDARSMMLQASLAMWRYTAEKDREYLQEETVFLENLKKNPYRSSFNLDLPQRAGHSH